MATKEKVEEYISAEDIPAMEKALRDKRNADRKAGQMERRRKAGSKVGKKGNARKGSSEMNPLKLMSTDNQEANVEQIVKAMSGIRWLNQPPDTAEELAERFNEYFLECARIGRVPTITGLAVTAGVDVQTLGAWEKQKSRAGSGFDDVVKHAKEYVRYLLEVQAADGKLPQVVYIFMGKNYFGMSDKVEQEIDIKNALTNIETGPDLQRRIAESIPAEAKIVENAEVIEDFEE